MKSTRKSFISTGIDQSPVIEADDSNEAGTNEAGTSGGDPAGVLNNLTFMIQIVTSNEKKALKPENFKGLNDVVELPAGELYRYATGNFPNYSDATDYRKKIESIYPGAFVIAVKDNKILPLQEALGSKQEK